MFFIYLIHLILASYEHQMSIDNFDVSFLPTDRIPFIANSQNVQSKLQEKSPKYMETSNEHNTRFLNTNLMIRNPAKNVNENLQKSTDFNIFNISILISYKKIYKRYLDSNPTKNITYTTKIFSIRKKFLRQFNSCNANIKKMSSITTIIYLTYLPDLKCQLKMLNVNVYVLEKAYEWLNFLDKIFYNLLQIKKKMKKTKSKNIFSLEIDLTNLNILEILEKLPIQWIVHLIEGVKKFSHNDNLEILSQFELVIFLLRCKIKALYQESKKYKMALNELIVS